MNELLGKEIKKIYVSMSEILKYVHEEWTAIKISSLTPLT